MTREEAIKVIDLNKDRLSNSMRIAVETIMQEFFLPSDVDEAAEAGGTQYYIANGYSPFPHIECDAYKNGFKAGAEWQKKQQNEK